MRFQTIDGGDASASALFYKDPPPSLTDYLYNNMANVLNTATNLSSSFVDSVKSMFHTAHSDEKRNFNSFIKYQAGEHLGDNTVYPIPKPKIPFANPIMQQYIMVQPQVHSLYRRDLLYGYGSTYVPLEQNVDNQDTVLYSNAMNGVVQFDQNGNGYISHYTDSNNDIIPELTKYEQLSILETWDNVKLLLAEGIDPTTGEER